jgi:hypothetical protein
VERREDLAAHAEVGMVHVSAFGSFREAEGQAAEVIGGHWSSSLHRRRISYKNSLVLAWLCSYPGLVRRSEVPSYEGVTNIAEAAGGVVNEVREKSLYPNDFDWIQVRITGSVGLSRAKIGYVRVRKGKTSNEIEILDWSESIYNPVEIHLQYSARRCSLGPGVASIDFA